MTDFKLLIDGRLVDGARRLDVVNPANEKIIGRCPLADEAQLDLAVASAKRAFAGWAGVPIALRAQAIARLADAIEAKADEFTRLLTAEQGKPLDQARLEIVGAVHVLRAFAGMSIEAKVLRADASGKVLEVRSPLGVVAAIMPWNFPVILLMNKIGPALLAGNTMVAKPAPTTPLTTLLFGTIASEILPPGVLNIICDDNDLGERLTSHPDVAKVAFTGSTATGKNVLRSTADTLKRVTLELGGNDAAIVLDDADPIEAARNVFQGAMVNAGQVCVAIKRAYVPEQMYDRFCDELVRLARATIVDDGTRQGAQVGPVQNRKQFEKLKDLLADSREHGRIVAGGAALDRPGYFIAPTVIRDVDDDARIVREEQFGPVLPVLKYRDLDDVIARANDSEYGLAGTVWGKDLDRAIAVAGAIQSGTVWVNQHLAIDPAIPFRGAKQSGLGVELGQEGLHEYTLATIINVAV